MCLLLVLLSIKINQILSNVIKYYLNNYKNIQKKFIVKLKGLTLLINKFNIENV